MGGRSKENGARRGVRQGKRPPPKHVREEGKGGRPKAHKEAGWDAKMIREDGWTGRRGGTKVTMHVWKPARGEGDRRSAHLRSLSWAK